MAVISQRPSDPSLGLAGALLAALRDPPVWDKRVLQLALHWADPGVVEDVADSAAGGGAKADGGKDRQWAAERLSVFLVTWDPFEWLPDRTAAFATSARRPNGDGDGVGLVLYLPVWEALALAGDDVAGVGSVIGQLAESVLAVAGAPRARESLEAGTFAEAVHNGTQESLLDRVPDIPALPEPTVTVVGDGWRAMEYDVLEDLAQDAFGPADLDHTPVRFAQTGSGVGTFPRCPGCLERSVEFPDGLQGAQDDMCPEHRAEALRVIAERLEAAQSSNPAGWEALLDAGQRLQEPHLPKGLGPRLVAAANRAAGVGPGSAADLVLEAARVLRGLPDAATPLGERMAPVRSWLEVLPGQLAGQVSGDQLARVNEAIAVLLNNPLGGAVEAAAKPVPFRRDVRVGRNAPCPCGSGKKYKFCHG